jgi:hypothetical protein
MRMTTRRRRMLAEPGPTGAAGVCPGYATRPGEGTGVRSECTRGPVAERMFSGA